MLFWRASSRVGAAARAAWRFLTINITLLQQGGILFMGQTRMNLPARTEVGFEH